MGQAAFRANRERSAVADRRGDPDKASDGDDAHGLRFIIHKHDARRSHFDFRLELDGTLKSWAVTHGPSLDPGEKRLAVRTDDQPVEKRIDADEIGPAEQFDGNVLWDAGCWHPRGDPREGLESGVLKFDLEGDRLKGAFVLMRLGNNAKSKRENWLLIKGRDRYAQSAEAPVKAWAGKVESPPNLEGKVVRDTEPSSMRKPATLPAFVAPQLATLVAAPPAGENWIHEIKYDGYRAIAAVAGNDARIYTRSGQDWTPKFPRIAEALPELDVRSALLDGEIVALGADGRSDFARLQHGLKSGELALTYYVFDLLELDGRDLRGEPLVRRKELLRKLLQDPPDAVRYSDHVAGHGDEMLAKACRMGLEGVVSKRVDLAYESRRSHGWLKSKCTGNDEFVIGGYRVSTKKSRAFASLLLGEFDGKALHYRGRVGTGFDDRDLEVIGAKLAKLARSKNPFVDAPREIARDARWVEPRLVAQIAYTERTRDGLLRHPAFLGLRGDKPAKDVQSRPALKTADVSGPASPVKSKRQPAKKRAPR